MATLAHKNVLYPNGKISNENEINLTHVHVI